MGMDMAVSIKQLIDKLELQNLTPEVDITGIKVTQPDINRPALQLAGYFEHYDETRPQIIGFVEYSYMEHMTEEDKREVYPKVLSEKTPCIVFCRDLRPDEIFELFKDTFENVTTPYNINGVHFKQLDEGRIEAQVTSNYEGGEYATAYAEGNGRLNAVSNALKQQYNLQYDLVSYTEHALEQSSSAQAIAYVGIKKPDGILSWGAGVDPDIIRASIDALVTAINNR